jgi:hypothetical protein
MILKFHPHYLFIVYLMTLFTAQIMQHQMEAWLVKWKGCRKQQSNFTICIPGLPENKAGALRT